MSPLVTPSLLTYTRCRAPQVALDARLFAPGADPLHVHPLTNEASTPLPGALLKAFLERTGHKFEVVDFAAL